MNGVFEKSILVASLYSVKQFFRNMKYAWQRAAKGYCDRDAHSMRDWFLSTAPNILEQYKNNLHSFPAHLFPELTPDEQYAKWKETLEEMLFLFREANDETCSRKNPLEDEWLKARKAFEEEYGSFGEKLLTDEARERANKGHGLRVYFLSDVPEYKEISDRYAAEQGLIDQYKDECLQKALEMFHKYFYDLWD